MPRKGYKQTGEHKGKISLTKQGQIPWNKGKHLSEEHRKKLSEVNVGDKNPQWKGGIIKDKDGRILIWRPEHPFAQKKGYVSRSHLIMEKIIGRYLKPKEQVHHKNGIKNDDRPENLKLFPSAATHIKFHHLKKCS